MKLLELDFLNQVKQITETQLNITIDADLNNQEHFDSLALMSIAAWVSDNYNLNINVLDLQKIGTLNSPNKLISKI
jgi:acyl carrier protein